MAICWIITPRKVIIPPQHMDTLSFLWRSHCCYNAC